MRNGNPANGVSDGSARVNEKLPPEDAVSEKKYKYPKSVFFIISNEFCERFSYYGMRTILALYLNEQLGYSEDMSTVLYHIFVMLCYFTPVFGGIMADTWLGKYRTILYVSVIYAIGNIVLSASSVSSWNEPHAVIAIIGLALIGIGTGGIKPCVSSFGGDQFVLPQQASQLEKFFSVFYFSINAGSVISCFLTPILREDVQCFGALTCYPLAFGVPAILMIASLMIFVSGTRFYKMKNPEGNIVLDVSKCCSYAVVRKVQTKNRKESHWLDYALDKYPQQLVDDTKIFLNLVVLFLPTIVFWALYEQQGSRWTFQANRMDGNLWGFVLQPDQMQTLNPVLVLIFIPLFDYGVYPVLRKLRLVRSSLQKMCWGGVLAGLAFVISGLLQLKIEAGYAVTPTSSQSQLRLYNDLNCNVSVYSSELDINTTIMSMATKEFTKLNANSTYSINIETVNCSNSVNFSGNAQLSYGDISSYLIATDNQQPQFELISLDTDVTKSENASGKVSAIFGGDTTLLVKLSSSAETKTFEVVNHTSPVWELSSYKTYDVYIDDGSGYGSELTSVKIMPGGVYTLLVNKNDSTYSVVMLTITTPNEINILWQVPQYVVISAAEIMFSITGLEFSYSQAPVSMKSVISSFWLLTDAFGNVIILVIAGVEIFSSQAYEMFLYAGLMFVVMGIFIILSLRYKNPRIKKEEEELPEVPNF